MLSAGGSSGCSCSSRRCHCHRPSLQRPCLAFSLSMTPFVDKFSILDAHTVVPGCQPCPWLLNSKSGAGKHEGTQTFSTNSWSQQVFQGDFKTLHPFRVSLCWGIVAMWVFVPGSTHSPSPELTPCQGLGLIHTPLHTQGTRIKPCVLINKSSHQWLLHFLTAACRVSEFPTQKMAEHRLCLAC